MSHLLELRHLKKSYGSKTILQDISLNIKPGEIVGLLGPNGAGKTTAFYLTIGLLKPDGGEIFFKGSQITHDCMHKRALMGIGYLAQEPSIFGSLTVEENIFAILEITESSHKLFTKKEKQKKLQSLLEELSLDHLATKRASTLSGGERRRLEITRALINQPSLLLLDEPFANIDPITIEDVKKLMLFLKKKGISILITDHNAREIFSCVDRSYLFQNGHILVEGTSNELIHHPLAKKHYLGEEFTI